MFWSCCKFLQDVEFPSLWLPNKQQRSCLSFYWLSFSIEQSNRRSCCIATEKKTKTHCYGNSGFFDSLYITPLCHRPGGNPNPLEKQAQNSSPVKKNPSSSPLRKMEYYYPHCRVKIWICRPHWAFGLKTMEIDIPSYKIKGIFYPHSSYKNSTWSVETGVMYPLSL